MYPAPATATEATGAGTLRRALPWLLLSLVLHLLLLAWTQRGEPPALQWQSLKVALVQQPAHNPPRASRGKGEQEPRAAQPTHHSPQAVTAPVPVEHAVTRSATAPTTRPSVEQTREAPSSAQTAVHDQRQTEQALTATLQLALARHFLYPTMAKRRGWQGEVLLAFRLGTNGTIMDAHIARSSGYGVLDRAALNALGKIKRINHTLRHELDMQLPVIYRLQEG